MSNDSGIIVSTLGCKPSREQELEAAIRWLYMRIGSLAVSSTTQPLWHTTKQIMERYQISKEGDLFEAD